MSSRYNTISNINNNNNKEVIFKSTSNATSTSVVNINGVEHTVTASSSATSTGKTPEEAKIKSEALASKKSVEEAAKIIDNLYTYKCRI